MARGDKATYNQQEQQSYNNANKATQQGQANQQASFNQAFGGYSGELADPGYSAAEKQAMTQATTGSLAGAFGAARDRAIAGQARTGNAAGVNATNEELALQQGRENAQALGTLQGQFGQARISGQQDAMRGMSGLYGTSTQGADSGMANAGNLVGTQERAAAQPGFWGNLLAGGLAAVGKGGR